MGVLVDSTLNNHIKTAYLAKDFSIKLRSQNVFALIMHSISHQQEFVNVMNTHLKTTVFARDAILFH